MALAMTAAALYRVPVETRRLAREPVGHGAATDLKKRHIEVDAWFQGAPVYGTIESADYPPASYPVFWPFVGWGMSLDAARLVWAATSVVLLGWLAWALPRAAGATDGLHRWFLAAVPLALYSTAASIRIGQASIHLMAAMLASVMLLANPRIRTDRWRTVAAAALMLLALTKPTFTAPLVWLLLVHGTVASIVTLFGGYVALTLLGASFQHPSLVALVQGWLGQSGSVQYDTAHANIHSWLGQMGHDSWLLPASLLILLLAGVWTWVHRRTDVWLVAGVLALVARFWSYHRWYDDILILLPLIALFREGRRRDTNDPVGHACVALLLLVVAFGIAPASILEAPPPWGDAFKRTKTIAWLASLGLLMVLARRAALPTRELPEAAVFAPSA